MQITLDHQEIVSSIKAYVRTLVSISENQDIEIELKAGRGENGYSATLDIVPAQMKAKPKPTYRGDTTDSDDVQKPKAVTSVKDEAPANRENPFDDDEPKVKAKDEVKAETKANTIFSKVGS